MTQSRVGRRSGHLPGHASTPVHAWCRLAPRDLRVAAAVSVLAIVVGTLIAYAFATGVDMQWRKGNFVWLTPYLFLTEDAFWLVIIGLLLGAVALISIPNASVPGLPSVFRYPRRSSPLPRAPSCFAGSSEPTPSFTAII